MKSRTRKNLHKVDAAMKSKKPMYKHNLLGALRRLGFGNAALVKYTGITLQELKEASKISLVEAKADKSLQLKRSKLNLKLDILAQVLIRQNLKQGYLLPIG